MREASLQSVRVEPERPAVDVGKVLQFTAMALFTGMRRDVTAEAQWQVSEPAIAGNAIYIRTHKTLYAFAEAE